MEEIRKITKAYFQASTGQVRKLAHDFFNLMDRDGNGQVDLCEFLTFMADEGYAQMTSNYFFDKLDLDRNGKLDFCEVMALYYIVKSGRPFCDHCKDFIPGAYFTCVRCLEGFGDTFHLCLDCHLEKKSQHSHEGVSHFLDNYSLLEAKIRFTLNQDHQSRSSRSLGVNSWPSSTTKQTNASTVPYSNNAFVPAHNYYTGPPLAQHNWKPYYYPYPPSAPIHYAPSAPIHYAPSAPIHYAPSAQIHYAPSAPIHYAPSAPIHSPVATSHTYIPDKQRWKIALEALETATTVGMIGTTIATLASCTIL